MSTVQQNSTNEQVKYFGILMRSKNTVQTFNITGTEVNTNANLFVKFFIKFIFKTVILNCI